MGRETGERTREEVMRTKKGGKGREAGRKGWRRRTGGENEAYRLIKGGERKEERN